MPTVERVSDRIGLVNRDSGRHALDFVDLRAVHTVHELANVGAEGFDIAALAFGIKSVKTKEDLPEPETPVTTVNLPCSKETSIFLSCFVLLRGRR